jgi:hypothetical protein
MAEAKPLNLDAHLGKVKNRIALVGVELEGGWKTLPTGVARLEHDGSVFKGQLPPGVKHIGELPIGPAAPAGIAQLIRENHPTQVNPTCGLHVHMSFDTLHPYQLLMVPEYQETILDYLSRWAKEKNIPEKHCLWDRLAGKSEYCQKKFWPDLQATAKNKGHDRNAHGHRYTIIHYCGRYKTIECRVLPMFSSRELSVSAVQRVMEITNACIYTLGQNVSDRKKFNSKVELPNNLVYEETIVEKI